MKNSNLSSVVRGTLYAVIVTLVLALGVALVVWLFDLRGATLTITAQVIKVVSIIFGTALATRNVQKRSWLIGAVVGILYTCLVFVLISFVEISVQGETFDITSSLITELAFTAVVGAIAAMFIRGKRNSNV